MPDHLDSIFGNLISAAKTEMEAICVEIEADIKDRVGDLYPPSSQPGTPPHKRTGGYQESFTHEVVTIEDGAQVQGDVSNPSDLSSWLENGTYRMAARPHFGPTFEDWSVKVPDRLGAAVNTSPQTI